MGVRTVIKRQCPEAAAPTKGLQPRNPMRNALICNDYGCVVWQEYGVLKIV